MTLVAVLPPSLIPAFIAGRKRAFCTASFETASTRFLSGNTATLTIVVYTNAAASRKESRFRSWPANASSQRDSYLVLRRAATAQVKSCVSAASRTTFCHRHRSASHHSTVRGMMLLSQQSSPSSMPPQRTHAQRELQHSQASIRCR